MAVYGRHKERWNPTKSKSKVSKNLTYELNGSTAKVLFWMNIDSFDDANDAFLGPKGEDTTLGDIVFDAYSHGGLPLPSIVPIKGSQFEANALHFDKGQAGNARSLVQTGENELTITPAQIGAPSRTHDTYISFWVKIYEENYSVSGGHNIGGLYRNVTNTSAQQTSTTITSPFCLFGITSSGAPELTFIEHNGVNNRIHYAGDVNDLTIEPGEWTQVTWLIKKPTGGPTWDYSSMVELYVNGQKVVNLGANDEAGASPDSASTVWFDEVVGYEHLELVFGNQTKGYLAGYNNLQGAGEGFAGALGEFLIFTQPVGDEAERANVTKFIYEAQREGAYHLHSGIHSSSPRLEQLDLDRDSSVPPNFSMPAYTRVSTELQYDDERDFSSSLRSSSRFTEGYKPSETWEEKASKYYIQSDTVLPHLRLDPNDTILTNGNWYSDARSEFFSEDLDPTSGFLVPDASSDELYREHAHTTTVTAFHDMNVPEEYKDCFVIEIPLHNTAELTLGTEVGDGVNGNNFGEEVSTFQAEMGTEDVNFEQVNHFDSNQNINTMAYYNFKEQKWETTTSPWSTHNLSPGVHNWMASADIGFSPLTGLYFPNNFEDLQLMSSLLGKPMSDFGFPFHRKFESGNSGQTIDLSQYLDEAVILEGWEMYTPVVPKVGTDNPVGYDYDAAGGKGGDHYGTQGHSASFWNAKEYLAPFEARHLTHTDGTKYFLDGTIPVSNWTDSDGDGEVDTEGHPLVETPGLVTKGVTAFLMKETERVVDHAQKAKFQSIDRLVSFDGNHIEYGFEGSRTLSSEPILLSGGEGALYDINLKDEYGESDGDWPALSDTWYDPIGAGTGTESRFSGGSTREIIGYLQHVYHNDENIKLPRTKWQRWEDPGTLDNNYPYTDSTDNTNQGPFFGLKPEWDAISMETILGADNYTYVYHNDGINPAQDLLRTNEQLYPFHVSGSLRGEIPYGGGIPVNTFAIAATSDIGPGSVDRGIWEPTAQIQTHMITGEQYWDLSLTDQAMFKVTTIVGNNEGNTSADFINYDSVPTIIGKGPTTIVEFPRFALPNGGNLLSQVADPVTNPDGIPLQAGNLTRLVECSPDDNAPTDTILRPSDKLILGIQDSVSTTFASQQAIQPGDAFLGWGRNSLKLVENQSGYLRLYVRRTRNDKPYNAVSDESNYNLVVNRDLGDHAIDDDFFINSPSMYSGSMADDIMGPTYLTPPDLRISVTPQADAENIEAVAGFVNFSDTAAQAQRFGVHVFRQITDRDQLTFTDKYLPAAAISAGYDPAIQPMIDDMSGDTPETSIPWRYASSVVFQPRSQDSSRHKPAIPWRDDWVPSWTSHQAGLGTSSGAIWSQYNQFLEMFHWVIAEPATNPPSQAMYDNVPYEIGQVNPAGIRNRCTAHPDELNTNGDITSGVLTLNNISGHNPGVVDLTLMGYDNPAMSAWYTKLVIPCFLSNPSFLSPAANAVVVEFRLVKIPSISDSDISNGTFGTVPTYEDGTSMQLGDVWYFNEQNERIKVKMYRDEFNPPHWNSEVFLNLAAADGSQDLDRRFFSTREQDWARNWYPKRAQYNGPLLFIVAAECRVESQAWASIEDTATQVVDSWGNTDPYKRVLTIKDVYSIISRTLAIQMEADRSLLGTVENYWDGNATVTDGKLDLGHDGSFSIVLPKDPNVRATFETFKEDVNDLMKFTLCGKDMSSDDADQLLREDIYLYKPTGAPHHLDPTAGDPATYDSNYAQGGDLPNGTFWDGDTYNHYQQDNDGFVSEYNRPFQNLAVSTLQCQERNFTLDYSNMITSVPTLEIQRETFSEATGRSIDRFVERRSSTDVSNYVDGAPQIAGPFGSLKKTIALHSSDVYLDSLVPHSLRGNTGYAVGFAHGTKEEAEAAGATWVETDYMTTIFDIPEEFPFETTTKRVFEVDPQEVKIKMRTSLGESGETGIDPSNSSRINYTNVSDEQYVGTVDWGTAVFEEVPHTEGLAGLLNVTNYIQANASQLSKFQRKTPRDLLLGFGDGVKGSHTLRPFMYPNTLAWTGTTPTRFAYEFIMDKPRGAKFGLYSTQRMSPTYRFSYRHYGYLSDMLEQGLDSKTTRHKSDELIFGSPVVVNPINPTNPEIPKLMENTSRYNKTIDCTIVKPYIEDNYEGIPNPVNLQSEKLRVDVAGSIKSRQILAPGNVASNIRRR